ncbi:MAG: sorbosone dehydrogenase family protein, partial [Saprospiraceae bacterium]
MKNIFLLLFCSLYLPTFAQLELVATRVSPDLNSPVDISHAGDGRIFVVEQGGVIKWMTRGQIIDVGEFLDIDGRVRSGGERGLLGLAFHPDYANNGYFYVNYTNNAGHTVVSRFSVSADDPDSADPDSEQILMTVEQPFSNHNGGDLLFGPDGYLYIGMGDGGAGG